MHTAEHLSVDSLPGLPAVLMWQSGLASLIYGKLQCHACLPAFPMHERLQTCWVGQQTLGRVHEPTSS